MLQLTGVLNRVIWPLVFLVLQETVMLKLVLSKVMHLLVEVKVGTVSVEQLCILGGKSALHYHGSDIKKTDTY